MHNLSFGINPVRNSLDTIIFWQKADRRRPLKGNRAKSHTKKWNAQIRALKRKGVPES